MALSNLISNRLGIHEGDAAAIQELVVDVISDNTLRREVWDEASLYINSDASISDLHYVLDALVKSLKDPEETDE